LAKECVLDPGSVSFGAPVPAVLVRLIVRGAARRAISVFAFVERHLYSTFAATDFAIEYSSRFRRRFAARGAF